MSPHSHLFNRFLSFKFIARLVILCQRRSGYVISSPPLFLRLNNSRAGQNTVVSMAGEIRYIRKWTPMISCLDSSDLFSNPISVDHPDIDNRTPHTRTLFSPWIPLTSHANIINNVLDGFCSNFLSSIQQISQHVPIYQTHKSHRSQG
jgi:hypothetical protein